MLMDNGVREEEYDKKQFMCFSFLVSDVGYDHIHF